MPADFEELRLRVWRVGAGRYLIFANGPASSAEIVELPREKVESFVRRRNLLLEEEFGRIDPPGGCTTSVSDRMKELGEEVYSALFTPSLQNCLLECLDLVGQQAPARNLRLRFYLDEELRDLPVELCRVPRGPQGFLALHPARPDISIVRSVPGGTIPQGRLPSPSDDFVPVNILVVLPQPHGHELPASRVELEELKERIAPYRHSGFVHLHILGRDKLDEDQDPEPVTPENLGRRTELLSGPSIIVLIGHGEYDLERKEGMVLLEKANGEVERVPGRNRLAGLLARARELRLVVLNLCWGTQTRTEDRYAGLAQALVAAGIPSVIAMQYEVSDEAARKFGPECLARICDNATIDEAVREGRRLLSDIAATTDIGTLAVTTSEWCIPATLLHDAATIGWLFKVPRVFEDEDEKTELDPFGRGARDMDLFRKSRTVPTAIAAVDHCRSIHDWRTALSLCQVALHARNPNEALRRFQREAQFEVSIDTILRLCHELYEGTVTSGTQSSWGKLPAAVRDALRCLTEEQAIVAELQKCHARAESLLRDGRTAEALSVLQAQSDCALAGRLARFKDVPQLIAGLQGQLAESRRHWAEAERWYAMLPEPHPLRQARLAYVRARHLLTQGGNLTAAIQQLASIPGTGRNRAVESTLQFLRGRQMEEKQPDPNWKQAEEFYARVVEGDDVREAMQRRKYCQARLREAIADWSGARDLYTQCEGHADAANRLSYCDFRLAEQHQEWARVAQEFRALASHPAIGGDVAGRQKYAEARLAQEHAADLHAIAARSTHSWPSAVILQDEAKVAVAAWNDSAAAFSALPAAFRDVAARKAFCAGRAGELQARFGLALQHYQQALSALDGSSRATASTTPTGESWFDPRLREAIKDGVDRCEIWSRVRERFREKAWGEARNLLNRLAPGAEAVLASGRPPVELPFEQRLVCDWLTWCQRARVVVPILEKLANCTYVRDSEVPWGESACPYRVLAARQVTPDTRPDECLSSTDLSQLAASERAAVQALRQTEKRLRLDFGLYRVQDPRGAAAALQVAMGTDESFLTPDLDRVAASLGADEGIFWAILKQHDRALECFQRELARLPGDPALMHHLGLAAAGKIYLLRRAGTQEEIEDWHCLLAGWGPLFVHEPFWKAWHADRNGQYGREIPEGEVHRARQSLHRYWEDQISERSSYFPELALAWLVEQACAQAVAEGGRLPLPMMSRSVVCGPIGSRYWGLEDAVARWVEGFGFHATSWQQDVRNYFSELAEPALHLAQHRPTAAIAALARPRCELLLAGDPRCGCVPSQGQPPVIAAPECPGFRQANPAYRALPDSGACLRRAAGELWQRAHMALAEAAYVERDYSRAYEHWSEAASAAASSASDVLASVRSLVLSTCQELCASHQLSRLDALNEAVEQLENLLHRQWDSAGQEVRLALVEVLLARAQYLSDELEDEGLARTSSAVPAYGLAPDDPRVIHLLCQLDLDLAHQRFLDGDNQAFASLLDEAEELLNRGATVAPDDGCMADCREQWNELVRLRGEQPQPQPEIEPGARAEPRVRPFSKSTPADRDERVLARLTEAMIREARQEYAGALAEYWAIVREDPKNEEARAKLEWGYRSWILHLTEKGTRKEVLDVAHEAWRRCPQATALVDIFEALRDEMFPQQNGQGLN